MEFLINFKLINFIPIATLMILLLGGIAAFFIQPTTFHETRTSVFISIMGSIAVLILAFNVFLTTIHLEMQKNISNARYTKSAIDKLWLYPNDKITTLTKVRPEFRASLYYNNLTLYNLTKNRKNEPTIESALQEQELSILLIQTWEDYLTFRTISQTGDDVWLINFLQWAQSPYLKAQFEVLKYNFAKTTIELGELLFEYASKLPVPTTDPNLYNITAHKILKDKRLIGIYGEGKSHMR